MQPHGMQRNWIFNEAFSARPEASDIPEHYMQPPAPNASAMGGSNEMPGQQRQVDAKRNMGGQRVCDASLLRWVDSDGIRRTPPRYKSNVGEYDGNPHPEVAKRSKQFLVPSGMSNVPNIS
jgi:hypothetical protein